MTCPPSSPPTSTGSCQAPAHLSPDAFSLLGDTPAAEAAFHSYVSAVDALYETLAPLLRERNQWELFETAELPLCRVLAEMELAGCRVDTGALASFGEMLSQRAAALEREIYDLGGGELQHQFPQAAGRDPLRQTGPAPREEDQDRLVHQRRCAGKAPL